MKARLEENEPIAKDQRLSVHKVRG